MLHEEPTELVISNEHIFLGKNLKKTEKNLKNPIF